MDAVVNLKMSPAEHRLLVTGLTAHRDWLKDRRVATEAANVAEQDSDMRRGRRDRAKAMLQEESELTHLLERL